MEITVNVAPHRSVLSPFPFHKPRCIASRVSSSHGKRSNPGPVPAPRQSKFRVTERAETQRRSVDDSPAKLGSAQLLQFEREGHVCVRGLFDGEEMGALAGAVNDAARREKLNAYRHRVAVLCPGVDPFSLHSIAEAEAVIRQQVAGYCCCFLAVCLPL